MRLWSSRLLERDLATGAISEWGKVKYLLLPMILSSLAGGPKYLITPRYGTEPPEGSTRNFILYGIAMALVAYLGIRKAFRANQEADGKHFIERYIILSLPVMVRLTVILVPTLILLMIVVASLTRSFPHFRGSLMAALYVVFVLIYYWYFSLVTASIRRLGRLLKRTPIPPEGASAS